MTEPWHVKEKKGKDLGALHMGGLVKGTNALRLVSTDTVNNKHIASGLFSTRHVTYNEVSMP